MNNKTKYTINLLIVLFPFILYGVYLVICTIWPYCFTPDYVKQNQLDLIYNYKINFKSAIFLYSLILISFILFLVIFIYSDGDCYKRYDYDITISLFSISFLILSILILFNNNLNASFFNMINHKNPNNLVIGVTIKPERDLIENFDFLQESPISEENLNKIDDFNYIFKNKYHIFYYTESSFNEYSKDILTSENYDLLDDSNIFKDPDFYLLVIDRKNKKIYVNNNIGNNYTVEEIVNSVIELNEKSKKEKKMKFKEMFSNLKTKNIYI